MGKAAFVLGKAAEYGTSAVTAVKSYTGKAGEPNNTSLAD